MPKKKVKFYEKKEMRKEERDYLKKHMMRHGEQEQLGHTQPADDGSLEEIKVQTEPV